ncbi:hypothetical protein [Myxosarcina sp. GI1]|uniref:hypothetical protein n=1 Tax=Myxosarcina sp. GI1 TaxID=1541065 RepID=UPI00056A8B11|nr:hypothetical protein [Myxosarcina sp. GI1]
MSANNNLENFLIPLPRQKFTGVVTVETQKDKQWKMYFYLGKFLWIEGGYHPNRFWQKYMSQHFSDLDLKLMVLDLDLLSKSKNNLEQLKYNFLVSLVQKNHIKPEKAIALITTRTQDSFFDIIQQEHKQELQYQKQNYSAHQILKSGFNLSLARIDIERVMFESQQQWLAWKYKGLASCSPNLAPLLTNARELEEKLPDMIFKNMSRLLNGKHTIRDLELKMNKSLLDVACGLIPYFFKGYLKFKEIPDLAEIDISNLLTYKLMFET